MDLQKISSAEKIDKIINDVLEQEKDEYETIYHFEAAKIYLKALILYVRSEKSTEDDLYEEIYKITLLPTQTQEIIFTRNRQKDYYTVFDKFLGSAVAQTRMIIMTIVSEKIKNKLNK